MSERPWEKASSENDRENADVPSVSNWRRRDEELRSFLGIHPATIGQIFQASQQWEVPFPSYKVTARRLQRLHNRNRVKIAGGIRLSEVGHPSYVYTRRFIKTDWLLHEVYLSQYLIDQELLGETILRGTDVDPNLLPDATILTKPRFHIEMDMRTENYKKIRERMRLYRECGERVIWVTTTVQRAHGLKERSEGVDAQFVVMEQPCGETL